MTAKKEPGNVTLLISNQSFDVNPVDIEVRIDGEVVVRDDFNVEGEQPPQHNWQEYKLALGPGEHNLDASSRKGRADLHTTFNVDGTHMIMVAYWNQRQEKRRRSKGFFTVEHGLRQAATM